MIHIQQIDKSYQNKKVLKEVSLTIEQGKLTSIIGPNGAGKSTLLGIISGLIAKNQGFIKIKDKQLEEWNERELAKVLAILKQDNSIGLKITIEELVQFGRYPHSRGRLTKEDHNKVQEALEYMELESIKNQYINELSGGQRQRAFIAMIIAQDTEYVLLDEPLNSLDIKHAKEMMKIIRKLVDELNKTVVMVLHDINFASCYSDIIIAMQDGEILQIGNVEDIICSDTLDVLYDTPVRIEKYEDKKICIYYE